MQLQTISVKELRNNMPKIIKALGKGADYTLLYRSKPIAYIRPINDRPRKYKNLLNPPKSLIFSSKTSAVELVRRERD
jgi:antitoxin (DNA-binding transcriptional repressor) of toxin-antitoxin stability system